MSDVDARLLSQVEGETVESEHSRRSVRSAARNARLHFIRPRSPPNHFRSAVMLTI